MNHCCSRFSRLPPDGGLPPEPQPHKACLLSFVASIATLFTNVVLSTQILSGASVAPTTYGACLTSYALFGGLTVTGWAKFRKQRVEYCPQEEISPKDLSALNRKVYLTFFTYMMSNLSLLLSAFLGMGGVLSLEKVAWISLSSLSVGFLSQACCCASSNLEKRAENHWKLIKEEKTKQWAKDVVEKASRFQEAQKVV